MTEKEFKQQKVAERYARIHNTDIESAKELMRRDFLQPVGQERAEYVDRWGKPEEIKKKEKTPKWQIAEEAIKELNERKKNRKFI